MSGWILNFPRRAVRSRKLALPSGCGSLRVAQVTLPSALFESAIYFAPRRGSGLEEFKPQVLIGSALHLESLAQAAEAGQFRLQSLTFALYVIATSHEAPLADQTRRTLWQAFGVPVYEIFLDHESLPVATECAAHEGWHVEGGVTFMLESKELWYQRKRGVRRGTGLKGKLTAELCPCGREGTRILQPSINFHDPLRQAV